MKKDRAIINYLNSKPWAITKEALETIHEIVSNHMDGIPVAAVNQVSYDPYTYDGEPLIQVIPMHGTVAKKLYGLEAISGGATVKDWEKAIQGALDDPNVSGIVLDIDSPGGTIDGTKELADFIMSARGQKPIIAYANGQMCSAAYWIGSAADKIVAFDTAQVGSIGVIITHRDYSKAEEMQGVKTTHIYAGKYKALGTPYEPLSDASREKLQQSVDYYYTMFVDAVAQQRGTSSNLVLDKMAEGRVFIGSQAKEVGLVDVVGNLTVAINLAKEGGTTVTLKETIEKHGASAILAELVASHSASIPSAVVEAYQVATTPRVELPAEVQKQIDALQATVNQLAEEKAAAQAALEEERAQAALKEQKDKVVEALEAVGMQNDENLVAVGMTLGAEQFGHVVATITTLKNNQKALAKELFTETEGATTEPKVEEEGTGGPEHFEAAIDYVQKRDKCDDEVAARVAAKEFPTLYAKFIQP